MSAPTLATALHQRALITVESESAIRGLATLRNLTAHNDGSGLGVSVEKAREYVSLAEGVLYALSRPPSQPQ